MITRGTNPKEYSTTPLINHLHNKHPNDYAIFIEKKEKKKEAKAKEKEKKNEQEKKSINPSLQDFFEKKIDIKMERNNSRSMKIDELITDFIIGDLQAFKMVEEKSFQKLISFLEPRYSMPSRFYFSEKMISLLKEKMMVALRAILREVENVSICADAWTSLATDSYLGITCNKIILR